MKARWTVLSLSQTSGYAILALGCLLQVQDRWVKTGEIAECTGIPPAYLSKILHKLGQSGLITAKRGAYGGYALSRPARKISLLDVVEAVKGRPTKPACLIGLSECSDEHPCPAHEFWKKERERIWKKLSHLNLRDAAEYERERGTRIGQRGVGVKSG